VSVSSASSRCSAGTDRPQHGTGTTPGAGVWSVRAVALTGPQLHGPVRTIRADQCLEVAGCLALSSLATSTRPLTAWFTVWYPPRPWSATARPGERPTPGSRATSDRQPRAWRGDDSRVSLGRDVSGEAVRAGRGAGRRRSGYVSWQRHPPTGYRGRPARWAMPCSSWPPASRRECLSSTARASRTNGLRSTTAGKMPSAVRNARTASSWRPRSRASAWP
jgi:hypothetical protein